MAYLRSAQLINDARTMGAYSSTDAATMLRKTAARPSYDYFLSHSVQDQRLVLAIRERLIRMGKSVYIDWIDDQLLDRTRVTTTTARVLRSRMNVSSSLLYVTTRAATNSKWMPWELGYFDGHRGEQHVGIIPVEDSAGGTFAGQEYIGLYPVFEESHVQSEFLAATFNARRIAVASLPTR